MIIDENQLSHYYNIYVLQLPTNQIKTMFILLTNEPDIIIQLYVKGDQAYTYNLQP